jgi:hypothetical protein
VEAFARSQPQEKQVAVNYSVKTGGALAAKAAVKEFSPVCLRISQELGGKLNLCAVEGNMTQAQIVPPPLF